jgi:hypothetical protein
LTPVAFPPPQARIRYQNVELEPPVDCPGCPPAEISRAHPTLLTPLTSMIVSYWVRSSVSGRAPSSCSSSQADRDRSQLVVYALQVGFCLLLVLARSEQMKDTLIRGVGMRFAIANWLQAAWAIFWTFGSRWSFLAAEICILLNVINLCVSLVADPLDHLCLDRRVLTPPSSSLQRDRHHHASHAQSPALVARLHLCPRTDAALPRDALPDRLARQRLHVRTPTARGVSLSRAALTALSPPQSPYSVLGWENRDPATYARYSWQAVGIVAGCHLVGLIWVFLTRDAGASLQAPSTRAATCD